MVGTEPFRYPGVTPRAASVPLAVSPVYKFLTGIFYDLALKEYLFVEKIHL